MLQDKFNRIKQRFADVAELVDALALGASASGREGSKSFHPHQVELMRKTVHTGRFDTVIIDNIT